MFLMVVQYISIAICWCESAPLPQDTSQTMNRHKNTNSFAVRNILTEYLFRIEYCARQTRVCRAQYSILNSCTAQYSILRVANSNAPHASMFVGYVG